MGLEPFRECEISGFVDADADPFKLETEVCLPRLISGATSDAYFHQSSLGKVM